MSNGLALDFYRNENYGHCERLISPGSSMKARKHSIDFRLLPINLCEISEYLCCGIVKYFIYTKGKYLKG